MSLKKATLLLLVLTLLSRVLGVGREMVIAWKFGASAESDAFFIAYSIPYAFYSIVGVSLTAVIVPILAEYDAAGATDEGMRVASSTLNLVGIISVVLAAIGIVFSYQIAAAMGGNFPPHTLDLAAHLTALMMPSIIFMSLAGVAGGILNNYRVYSTPAIGPVLMNLVAITSVLFSDWLGIQALVIGTMLGTFAYILIQVPSFKTIGFRYRLKIDFGNDSLKRIITSIWSVMLVSACYYTYNLTDFSLASGMKSGSITALNYATRFIQLPQGIFTLAVTTAIFPPLSAHAARGEFDSVRKMLEKGTRMILLMAVPCSLGLIVVGHPLMTILFQHGKFGSAATEMAAQTLFCLTIGLVGFSLNLPLIRCFYSLRNQVWPLVVAICSIPIKIVLSIWLGALFQERGLALATSATYLINALIMVLLLRRKLPTFLGKKFLYFASRLAVASAGMLAFTYALDLFLVRWLLEAPFRDVIRVGVDIIAGGLIFAALGTILSISELNGALTQVLTKRTGIGALLSRHRPSEDHQKPTQPNEK